MKSKSLSYRSDMGRARGLGSAKDGTHHWWMAKLTAIALVPLVFWFACSVLSLIGADQAAVRHWLHQPLQAAMLLLFIGVALHHSANGVQVVMEDYIHGSVKKMTALIANKLVHGALAAVALCSILTLALKA